MVTKHFVGNKAMQTFSELHISFRLKHSYICNNDLNLFKQFFILLTLAAAIPMRFIQCCHCDFSSNQF